MNPYAIPPLVTDLILIIIGLSVFFKNRTSKLNIIFSLFTLSMAFWLFGYTNMYLNKDPVVALRWARIGFVGIIFIPVFAYHFIISFLNLKRKVVLPVIYLLTIPSLLFSQTNFIYGGIKEHFWGYYPTAGKFYILFLLMFAILFTRGVILLIMHLNKVTGLKKEQIKYVCLAFGLGTFGIIDYLIKYPVLDVYPFGYICALIFNSLIAYAMVRYHLLGINVMLTRAGIFAFVYLFVLGIPFVYGYKYGLWQPATWLMLALATLGPFFYNSLRRQAEAVLRAEERRYQRALSELSRTMARIRDIDQLLKAIVLTVVDKVKVSSAGIYLKSDEYKGYQLKHYYPKKEKERFPELIQPDAFSIAKLSLLKKPLTPEEAGLQDKIRIGSGLVIPCFIEEELLGFLCLGHKPNNSMYTPDDLLIFETLSYSTSLAIENCHFWREIEDRQRKARLQEMDTYSYSLAHEIDNPIQIVLGEAELLKRYLLKETTLSEDKQKELSSALDFITESAKRVSGMVKAIRDFGQKTTGEQRPLDIEDAAETFAKLYYPKFKEKTVFFNKTSKLNNPVFIRGEKPELMQVLFILADNSVHAMTGLKEKKIFLNIETANSDWVRIVFSDNGYGIKKENLEIIFKPFVTTKASTEGTGMGLHNAKKIIDKHKGRIWAESEGEGKGAAFIIELPILKEVNADELKAKDSKTLFVKPFKEK